MLCPAESSSFFGLGNFFLPGNRNDADVEDVLVTPRIDQLLEGRIDVTSCGRHEEVGGKVGPLGEWVVRQAAVVDVGESRGNSNSHWLVGCWPCPS